ncbi:MAG: hypothetical protein R3Y35_10710 [Clostridia bacterium]
MNLKILNIDEIEYIHKNHIPTTFPKNEIRSFSSMKQLFDTGNYFVAAAYEQDELAIYGFFTVDTVNNNYMLDYFSTVDGKQGGGLGSEFLKNLPKLIPNYNIIFLEVERIEFAQNLKEKDIRERRIGFYQRNNFTLSGVKSVVWDVPFNVMFYSKDKIASNIQMEKAVTDIYKIIFPTKIFNEKVQIQSAK